MDEQAQDPAAKPAAEAGPQTVEVPIAAIGNAKEGDMVTMKVISRDDQNGIANLAPAAPEEGKGSDDLAAAFDKNNLKAQ